MKKIKNLVVSGGFGEVATAMLGIIGEDSELYSSIENVYIFDTCSEERATLVLDAMKLHGNPLADKITHITTSYLRDLDYFLLENSIDTFIHLVADSSQSIWEAIKKVQLTTNEKILYLDASCYLSNFNTRLRSKKFRLHSNWELFDEIKSEYTDIIGSTSSGANPGILSNALANFVINGDGGELGLINLPKNGFGKENLKAIYVVENDSITSTKDFGDKVFTSNWQPYAALEEVVEEPLNFYNGMKCFMGKTAEHDSAFDAKCVVNFGDGTISKLANTVQHEECFLMAKKYGVESTFLYTVPSSTETQMEKVKSHEWEPLKLEYVTVSPLNTPDLAGTEKLGIMLVYVNDKTGESKEVVVFNESGKTHFGTSTHVPYQVAVGMVVPLKTYLQLMDTPAEDYLTLDWGDNHLDIQAFRKTYIKEMTKYLPLQMYIRDTTDGLVKDRLLNSKVKYNLINPDKEGFKASDFDDNSYTYEDTYVKYVEDAIYEAFEAANEPFDNFAMINDYIINNHISKIPKSTEGDWNKAMVNNFMTFLAENEDDDTDYSIFEDKINIMTYEISSFEDMLIGENVGEKAEIVEYLVKHIVELKHINYVSEDELFQEVYNHFHLIMR
jgi:hypothetical protein